MTTSPAASEAVCITPREGRARAASNSAATAGAAFECVSRGSSSSRPLLTLATCSATAGIGSRGFETTFLTTSNDFEVSTASHHSPAPAHEDIRSAAAARAQVEIYETLALRRAFRALRDSFPHRSIVPLATAHSRGRARHDAICNGCVKPPLHARVRPLQLLFPMQRN